MTLHRKLFRDLVRAWLPLLSVLVVAALGVATFVAMASCYRTLSRSEATFYRTYRLPDAFLNARRIPRHAVESLRADPAVRAVRGRVREGLSVLLEGRRSPIPGIGLSVPVPRRPILGDLSLTSGRWFSGPDAAEVLVNEQFAAAHGIRAGARLRVLLRGNELDLLVVGTAGDPEHVFLLPPGGGLAPDPEHYAVLYLPRDALAAAAGLQGGVNQLLFTLYDRRDAELEATMARLERRLDAHGVSASGPVSDWAAIQILRDKIGGLYGVSIVIPGVFLLMASLVLHILLSRIVVQQRSVLGTLRAVGYTRGEVTRHLAAFGGVTGVLGGGLGLVLGYGLHGAMLGLYGAYFKLPDLEVVVDPLLYGGAFLAAILAGVAGAFRAAKAAAELEPAESMRPAPPEHGQAIFLERWPALWAAFPFRLQLVTRAIFRNPGRSALSVVSTALSTSLVFALLCLLHSVGYLMEHTFALTAHEDLKIGLRDPVSIEGAREVLSLAGVDYVEAQLSVPVEIRSGRRQERIAIIGLPRVSTLTTPLDKRARPIVVPPRGLLLGSKVARNLDVRPGDEVVLKVMLGDRRTVVTMVAATVDVYIGLAAWCDQAYLSELLGEVAVTNSVLVTLGPSGSRDETVERLASRPEVVGVSDRTRSLELFDKEVAKTQEAALGVVVFLAGMLAFAITLNNLLVSLDERRREVGVLRTLGYTSSQTMALFAGEATALFSSGVLVGMFAGRGLVVALARSFDTEIFRFPVFIPPDRVVLAIALMGAFLVAALAVINSMISRLDWLEALQVKE